jgi:DnaJ-domain-containing protein 1
MLGIEFEDDPQHASIDRKRMKATQQTAQSRQAQRARDFFSVA